MNVVARRTLQAFMKAHADSRDAINAWYLVATKARWDNVADLRNAVPKVSVLNDNRVVFDLHGNKYRLVAKIHYKTKTLFVRFVGTHAEYDKIDANTV